MNFPLGKKNFQNLTASDLKQLIETQPDNMDAVLAYCSKVTADGGPASEGKCLMMVTRFRTKLIENADPIVVASVVLNIPLDKGALTPVHYLRLGGHLEAAGSIDQAGLCYRRIFDEDKTSKECEIGLMRLARLLEHEYNNPDQAREAYSVFLALFPTSQVADEAQRALERLPLPTEEAPAE